jgi:hypothetical protein
MYIKLNPYRSDDTVSIPAPPWLAPLLGTSGLTACCWCAACTLEILVACIPFCYLVFLVMLLWRYSKDGTEVETNGPLDVRVFNSAISFYSISLLMVKWDKASTPQYKRMPQICRHIITVNCVNMMRRGRHFQVRAEQMSCPLYIFPKKMRTERGILIHFLRAVNCENKMKARIFFITTQSK